MRILNNELVVHRGEAFTIDKTIVNKDGTPYIISSKLNNPYFLISVSTTKYEQQNRYIKNYWLNLANFPKFVSTQPLNINVFKSAKASSGSAVSLYNDFSDMEYNETDNVIAEGYIGENYVQYSPEDTVFYKSTDDAEEYKYFDVSSKSWVTYICKIVKTFYTDNTSEWVEQSYVYGIDLVSGASVISYLQQLCNDNAITYSDVDSISVLVNKLTKATVAISIDTSKPIVVDFKVPILIPTKLSVISNIKGGS